VDCPKCRGQMVQGFVLDRSQGQQLVSEWVPGAPRTSFWRGVKLPDETMLPIGAFRCAHCGFLEFYARAEFEAS
jgi:Domain of unknown function (DUF6487)